MPQDNGQTLPISDLYLAAYCVLKGHKVGGLRVEGVVGKNGHLRRSFVFEANKQLKLDMQDFVNNSPVEIQTFITKVYQLKRMLNAEEVTAP